VVDRAGYGGATMRSALVVLALGACGGVIQVDPAPPVVEDAGDASVPSFGDAGESHPVLAVCERCTSNAECGGPQYACVASEGAPFCSAGCAKDGYCLPHQSCTWVTDPEGKSWRACLDQGAQGDPCGALFPVSGDRGRLP